MKKAPRLRHCVTKRRPGPERRRRAGLRPSRDEEEAEGAGAGAGAWGSGLSVPPLRSPPGLARPGPAQPRRLCPAARSRSPIAPRAERGLCGTQQHRPGPVAVARPPSRAAAP